MKTLFTFAAIGLFSIMSMAADRYPTVTIKSKKQYQIVVDGRRYYNDNTIRLEKLRRGMHTVQVYERSRSLFGTRMRLVSSKNFLVRNNDIRITVNHSGYIDVDEMGNGWGRNRNDRHGDYDRNDRDWDQDRDKEYKPNRRY